MPPNLSYTNVLHVESGQEDMKVFSALNADKMVSCGHGVAAPGQLLSGLSHGRSVALLLQVGRERYAVVGSIPITATLAV